MNWAKKKKLIKISLISASTISLGAIVAIPTAVYTYNSKQVGLNQIPSIRKDQYLAPAATALKNPVVSISDTIDKNQKTVIQFIDSDTKKIVDTQTYTTDGKTLQIDISKILPLGYQLDQSKYPNGQVTITQGILNKIFITKLQNQEKTYIRFVTAGENGSSQVKPLTDYLEIKILNTNNLASVVNSILQQALPQTYQNYTFDTTGLQIINGQKNDIVLYLKNQLINTTIKYVEKTGNEDKVILTKTIPTLPSKFVDPAQYLPEGYEYDTTTNQNEKITITSALAAGSNVTYYVIPKPVVHYTSIVWMTEKDGKLVQVNTSTYSSTDKNPLTPDQILAQLPFGYQLPQGVTIDQNYINTNIKLDQSNKITVVPIPNLITTSFQFVNAANNYESVGQKFDITKPSNQTISISEIQSHLPSGFQIQNPDTFKVNYGAPNIVNVVPIQAKYKTTVTLVQYGTGNGIVVQKTFDSATVNVASVLNLVPDNKTYEFVDQSTGNPIDPSSLTVTANQNNTFYVKQIQKTVYKYTFGNQTVGTYDPTITNNTIPSGQGYAQHVPANYELDPSISGYNITIGATNQILVRPLQKLQSTTIVWVTQNADGTTSPQGSRTPLNVPVNQSPQQTAQYLKQFIPTGFVLAVPEQVLHIDFTKSENDITIKQASVTYTTTITFTFPDKNTPLTKTFTTVDDQKVDWQSAVPEGYVPENGYANTIVVPGSSNTIIPIVPKTNQSKPIQPDQPVTTLTSQQISQIISSGGSTESPSRTNPSPGSTLPVIDNPPITNQQQIAQFKQNFSTLDNLFTSALSDPNKQITGDELREVFKDQQNPAWLDVIAKILNGQNPTNDPRIAAMSVAERRQVALAQIQAAQRILQQELAKGLVPKFVIEGTGLNINYGYTSDDKNPTLVKYKEGNEKRFLGNSGIYNRNPQQILQGNYTGWIQNDVTSNYQSSYSIPNNGSLTISEYQPDPNNAFVPDKNQRLDFINLDTSNASAVQTAMNIFTNTSGPLYGKIKGLFLKDINVKSPTNPNGFDLGAFIKSIPDSVEKITFLFDNPNMTGISQLQYKTLKEVDLVTSANNINDNLGDSPNSALPQPGWGIDPNAFKNVAYISNDYNVNNGFNTQGQGQKTAGSIVFNIIRPDKGDTYEMVQNGFNIALVKDRGLPIYNGGQGDDGYPTKIDFSNVPNITSLYGININGRAFKTIKLAGNGSFANLSLQHIAQQQWDSLLYNWGPTEKSKVLFSTDVTTVHLSGDSSDFGAGWVKELQGLFYGLANAGTVKTIVVDNQNVYNIIAGSPAFSWLSGITLRVKNSTDNFQTGVASS